MSSDVELILKAIEGLHTNIIKDYILPVGTVFVSGLLGAGVAYYSIDRQEQTKIEIKKIEALNNVLLEAMQVRTNLIAIKENYFGQISDHPIDRLLSVPPILLPDNRLSINLSSLSFIAPKIEDNANEKWSSIGYIATIFSNYNSMLNIWTKRNDIIISLLPKLKPYFGRPIITEELQQIFGMAIIHQLSDLTELALQMTDEILIEVCDFMLGFSKLAKTKVHKRVAKKFGTILQVLLPENNKKIIQKVPEVNYAILSQVQGKPEQELRERYRPIYTQ